MASSQPLDGRSFVLNWMDFLHTSMPAIDFGSRRNSVTALPDLADQAPCTNSLSASGEKAPSCESVSQSGQHAQSATALSEPGSNLDPSFASTACSSQHAAGSEYDGISELQTADNPAYHQRREDLECWEHGCNGRVFTTSSNLARHKREHSDKRPAYHCPKCGAFFSRKTARNTHVENDSCTRIRRYSNGRKRPNFRK